MRVAINGFGRIGRSVFRANLLNPRINVVAINDLGDPKQTAHLLKYDTEYGVLPMDVKGEEGKLTVDGKEYILLQDREPLNLPWKDLDIDLVIDCTGVFKTREGAGKHLEAGAKRVVISAPGKGDIDRTIVMGVNQEDYNPETDFIISNASCTTNCLAPLAKVLNDEFGIKRGLMSTVHSYTSSQLLLDNDSPKDWRRGRSAARNMFPTTTGAAKALKLVIPDLEGKLNGQSIRVPLSVVSLVDLTVELDKATTVEAINAAMKKAADGPLKGIMKYSDEPLVSSDFRGDSHSSIFDALTTQAIDEHFFKVMAWYDNEWSYSERCIDLIEYIAKQEA